MACRSTGGKRSFSRQKLTHTYYGFASYVRREGHLKEVFLLLAKSRLILDEMCRLYGKFACYLRRVLCKTRLIFPLINGPIKVSTIYIPIHQVPTPAIKDTADLLTEHRNLTLPLRPWKIVSQFGTSNLRWTRSPIA